MNFQQRFKGKTSTISKTGVDGVVLSSANPIKKTLSTASSASQLSLFSSPSLENYIKRPPKIPSHPVIPESNSVILSDVSPVKSFTPNPTPGHHRQSFSSEIQNMNIFEPFRAFFAQNESTISLPKEKLNLSRQLGPLKPRGYSLNGKNASGLATKSINISQVLQEPSSIDQSASSFINLKSSTNQQNQVRTRGRSRTELQANQIVDLKVNRNHLHKKSFENLSQQNKTRMISQEIFKSLGRPEEAHHSRDHFLEETFANLEQYRKKKPSSQGVFRGLIRPEYSPQRTPHQGEDSLRDISHKVQRLYDSVQLPVKPESNTSFNLRHVASLKGLNDTNNEDKMIFGDIQTNDSRSSKNIGYIVLSKLKHRKSDNKGIRSDQRKVSWKDNDDLKEKRNGLKFGSLPEISKPSLINMGNLRQTNNIEKLKKTM